MADDYTATIRIRRPAKVTTDDRGRTVWAGEIETAELELVSTEELKQILASSDGESLSAIERVVSGEVEGVLARDPATGLFEIVTHGDLEKALEEGGEPPTVRLEALVPASGGGEEEELSLVSTQVLRKMLKSDEPRASKPASKAARPLPAPKPKRDQGGGFDPYNSG